MRPFIALRRFQRTLQQKSEQNECRFLYLFRGRNWQASKSKEKGKQITKRFRFIIERILLLVPISTVAELKERIE